MRIVNIYCYRISIVIVLTFGLIFSPLMPRIVGAAELGVGAAGSSADKKTSGSSKGKAAGAGVSGSSGKAAPAGKGALAPPPQKSPPAKTPAKAPAKKPIKPVPAPVKSADQTKVPKGIGASASKAGLPSTYSGKEGISTGWKIGAGVLGVGLLIALAGSGGSSSSH